MRLLRQIGEGEWPPLHKWIQEISATDAYSPAFSLQKRIQTLARQRLPEGFVLARPVRQPGELIDDRRLNVTLQNRQDLVPQSRAQARSIVIAGVFPPRLAQIAQIFP